MRARPASAEGLAAGGILGDSAARRTRGANRDGGAVEIEIGIGKSGRRAYGFDDIAIEVGELGGLACLNLEGLWTRYDDLDPIFEEIASLPTEKATRRMQELYAEPIKDELIGKRIAEIKGAGVVAAGSFTPQRVERYAKLVV